MNAAVRYVLSLMLGTLCLAQAALGAEPPVTHEFTLDNGLKVGEQVVTEGADNLHLPRPLRMHRSRRPCSSRRATCPSRSR